MKINLFLDMAFSINVGFHPLLNKEANDDKLAETYALFIGDTVVVGEVCFKDQYLVIKTDILV